MIVSKLTGRTRHRHHVVPHLFGENKVLMVLQAEVHSKGYEVLDSRGNSRDVDSLWWRDAELEDMLELQNAQVGPCGEAK